MERWKPGFGDAYYYVDNACSVDIERYDGHTWDDERIAVGNCFNTKDDAHAAAEKVKELLLSLQDSTNKLQDDIQDMVTNTCQAMDKGKENVAKATCNFGNLPKLTAEVFDRPDCPEWAQYAAVDGNGYAYYYSERPFVLSDEFGWGVVCGANTQSELIPSKFDAVNWQNSLIERPVKENKLPDWCKVGEWVFDKAINKYSQVAPEDITEHLQEVCKSISKGEIVQARPRPWTAREAIGKVICWQGDYSFQENLAVINAVDCDGDLMGDLIGNMNLKDLSRECFYQLDKSPCGVLEHLENGEWVQ